MAQETRKELLLQTTIPLEVRSEEGKPSKITGYASVFDEETDLGWFREKIARGAFTRTLKERPDVLALFDHDTSMPIGRSSAGTLSISEDSRGLPVEITPPNTTAGRDAVELVRTGHVKGMSFGFRVLEDKWSVRDGMDLRTILDVELYEVSVVTFPAYEGTTAQARSLVEGLSKRYLDPSEILATYKSREQRVANYSEGLKKRIVWLDKLA